MGQDFLYKLLERSFIYYYYLYIFFLGGGVKMKSKPLWKPQSI